MVRQNSASESTQNKSQNPGELVREIHWEHRLWMSTRIRMENAMKTVRISARLPEKKDRWNESVSCEILEQVQK